MLPDYNKGLVNLACSILKEFGAEYHHPTLTVMDELLERKYKNVIIVLLDGMGLDALNFHLNSDGFFKSHLVTDISSVFPPTTTAATTSLQTGLTPSEHGWLGWSLYFSEIDKIVNAFINTEKDTDHAVADYHVANRYIPYKSIYDQINETNNGKAYQVSKYGTNKINSFDELIGEVKRLSKEDGRKYIYAYWEDPDGLMHDYGCDHPIVTEDLRLLENKIACMTEELSDSLVIVTADHGHLNVNYYTLSDYPEIMKMLKRPVSVETRATAFYVKEAYMEDFPHVFKQIFGNDFILYTKDELKQNKLFGDGVLHVKFDEFVGDFMAIAISNMGIIYSNASKKLVSTHAGLTKNEMRVPFIAISK
jgi:predicted AlkP superfamily pyrophosphatase or phosphodiesterase